MPNALGLVVALLATLKEAACDQSCSPPKRQVHNTRGFQTWELSYNVTHPPRQLDCEWDLESPSGKPLLIVQIMDLYLVTDKGRCAADFILNGRKLCHTREEKSCFLFRTNSDDSCRKVSESIARDRCLTEDWKGAKRSVYLKADSAPASKVQRHMVHFLYTYVDCSSKGISAMGIKIGPGGPTLPEETWTVATDGGTITETDSALIPKRTLYSATIPLFLALCVVIAILCVVIFRRRCRHSKHDITLIEALSRRSALDSDETSESRYEIIDDFRRPDLKQEGHIIGGREVLDNVLYHSGPSVPDDGDFSFSASK